MNIPDFARTVTYTNVGTTLPAKSTMEEDSAFAIEDESLRNFSFSYSSTWHSTEYTHRLDEWIGGSPGVRVNWFIFSSEDADVVFTEPPYFLRLQYPEISFDLIRHYKTTFYHRLDGFTFGQFVDEKLGEAAVTSTMEFYAVSFVGI